MKKKTEVTVRVFHDCDINPREEYDNFCVIVYEGERYIIGDRQESTIDYLIGIASDVDEKAGDWENDLWYQVVVDNFHIADLGLRQGGGVFVSEWINSVERLKEMEENDELDCIAIMEKFYDREILESVVQIYDSYLGGNCYSYVAETEDEVIDSCLVGAPVEETIDFAIHSLDDLIGRGKYNLKVEVE